MCIRDSYRVEDFDADSYYANTIGVTVLSDTDIVTVVFRASRLHAPYILTKPLHHSQEMVERHEDRSMTFSMRVHHNSELEKKLLAFGEGITVLKPARLVKKLKKRTQMSLENYEQAM